MGLVMNLDTHTLWFEAERDRQTRLVGCWMDDDFGHAKMSHQYVDTRDHCGLMLSSTSSSSQVGLQRYLGTSLAPSLWSLCLGCCQVTGCHGLSLCCQQQLPQLGDDVVEQEVVAPVHHVDQEEHEREEHQRDAVHAVAPAITMDVGCLIL